MNSTELKKEKPAGETVVVKETQPWRTFSIFISSAFADMQAERDPLKNVVSRRLKTSCRYL